MLIEFISCSDALVRQIWADSRVTSFLNDEKFCH